MTKPFELIDELSARIAEVARRENPEIQLTTPSIPLTGRARKPQVSLAYRGKQSVLMPSIQSISIAHPTAVLGDIHGRLDLLDRLLPQLDNRHIVVIGDVIDRGPDTRTVINRLIERGAVGVLGNHEEWLLAWLRGEGFDDWAIKPKMGGLATLRSYGAVGDTRSALEPQTWCVPEAHRRFLESLARVGDLEVMGQPYWLVHAGIPTHVSLAGVPFDRAVPHLAEKHAHDLLWGSNDPEAMLPLGRPVIMGHQPRQAPLDTGDVIAIDTGAGTLEGGRLTALLLPERKFVTVGP